MALISGFHEWASREVVLSILLSFVLCHRLTIITNGVVVDGEKKKDVLATAKQSSEASMIDAFNTKSCGLSDANFEEHEFVSMSREGQFPWMVSFQVEVPKNASKAVQEEAAKKTVGEIERSLHKKTQDLHFCSGSFISDKWILSAAHCFEPKSIETYLKNNKLKAVAGSTRVKSRSRNNRNLTISKIYYHSSFDKSMPIGFDIALVELKEPVNLSQKRVDSEFGEQAQPFMNTICLPLKDKKYQFNESARIAGWGLSNEKDESSMPSKLLTTDILISAKTDCVQGYVKSLKSDRPKHQSEKYDDFLCASYKDTRDACQSDSGGPLMQFAGGKAVAIGIVSYGIGCATKGVPGLYTRTSAYINWIKDITKLGEKASVAYKLIKASTSEVSRTGISTTPRPTPVKTNKLTTTMPMLTTTTGKPAKLTLSASKSPGSFRFFDD